MVYVSDLLGRRVTDVDGEAVGRLTDLVASVRGNMSHPQIVAIQVTRRGESKVIPVGSVAVLISPVIPLNRRSSEISAHEPGPHDLFLARDVLDRQIIDTNGVRVVRVNDLELVRVNGHYFLANVDIGGYGLLRRVGLGGLARKLGGHSESGRPRGTISWDGVELIPGDEQPMRLKVTGDSMSDLHPADLAEIISDLSRAESSKLLDSLDVERVADTLEEVEPEFQASLVEGMTNEKVADVLEAMAPDEAADLLAELPKDRSKELLSLMEADEARDVRKLLTYAEDTAGGIMNTEFIAIPPDLTAQQATEILRQRSEEAETIFYVYVTDSEGHLIGVFSLRDLVLARPECPVEQFMHRRVVSVNLKDTQTDVAQAVAKYNLVAVPVVDDERKIHGIVTADDALDKIIPTAWKKRLPRLYN